MNTPPDAQAPCGKAIVTHTSQQHMPRPLFCASSALPDLPRQQQKSNTYTHVISPDPYREQLGHVTHHVHHVHHRLLESSDASVVKPSRASSTMLELHTLPPQLAVSTATHTQRRFESTLWWLFCASSTLPDLPRPPQLRPSKDKPTCECSPKLIF
jgi:hypothetical protein